MEPRTLAVLEELLRFRDGLAREHDLPPFKILGSDTLRQLAENKPQRQSDLDGITGLSPKLCKRYGRGILEATARGMALPADRLPSYPRPQQFVKDRRKDEMMRSLKQWREAKAGELGVAAGILVNNSMLEAVADAACRNEGGAPAIPAMKQWQKEAFGEDLLRFVNN